MKTLVLSMISIAATVAAMTACTSESDPINEVDPIVNAKVPIEFSSSIIETTTKAMGKDVTKFDENDEIAITMYKGEAAPTGAALGSPSNDKVSFTVGADQSSLAETATGKKMFWERNTNHYFYAFYPITASDLTYTAPDGVSKAGIITIRTPVTGLSTDLLMGKNTNGLTFSGAKVDNALLQFNHKLSKIKFTLKKDESFHGSAVLSKISLNIQNSEVSFDVVNQTATLGGSSIDIAQDGLSTTISTSTDLDWSPIVAPGTTINSLKLTIDSKEIEAKDLTATLSGGSITTITITLKGSGITDLTTGITDWGAESGTGEII